MLEGKVALVTGAGRGIGREIALQLAQHGAKVVVNYRGNKAKVDELIEVIKHAGGEAIAAKADISKEDDAKELINVAVKQYERLDILVNNAGITKDGLLIRMSEEDFDKVIDTNLKGAFFCLKYGAAVMLKQRTGKIINISSIVGVTGNIGQINYSASKAGLIGMTKTAARELASRGITVNAVAPGFIQTDMTEGLPERVKKAGLESIPLKRFGSTAEVAGTVSFLASDAANYITGQVICVDGGIAM